MPFVAIVTFVMYWKVCLLLDDIAEVAAEGNERCFGGLRMHIELRSTFQSYTTVISSTEISANNCSPHKLNHGKTAAGEGPKSYVHPCEHH